MKSIHHHPSDDTLACYVRGGLQEGPRTVVEAHIELCASCARMVGAANHIAGRMLDSAPPVALEQDALQKTLARIAAERDWKDLTPVRAAERGPFGIRALAEHHLGPWRWIGPGVHWRSVSEPAGGGARVFMLKAAPGTSLPHHTHTGTELTLVLKGAFSHQGGRFGIGDVEEADGSVDHQPVVDPGDECICLVAMEGQLRLLGWVGRLMQPFVRM